MYSKEKIIKFISQNKSVSFIKIARFFKVANNENKKLSGLLFELLESGEIFADSERNYFVPNILHVDQGVIRINPKGFGFIDFDDTKKNSVFVPSQHTKNAMDGDVVEVKVLKDSLRPDSYLGIVSKIITRKRSTFVGRIMKTNGFWNIKPLDARITGRFRFEDESNLKMDDEVKVEITEFTPKFNKIKVVKILGNKDDVSVDILAAIEDANIPTEFNVGTKNAAKKIASSVSSEEIINRVDLRKNMIVTIDGDDTKDFDDAIEVKKLDDGLYVLSVHIADVTHYVTENSPLDEEALMRGTSVYLADRVIPMLPEELSNGICSLNPRQDRLTLSVDITIDQSGKTVDYKIYEAVICSRYRLTYQEVNKYFKNKENVWEDKELTSMLDNALELSKIIRKFKEKEGYIDFEIEESKIIIDQSGKTVDIVPRERLESEMLIEDFMVRANETVAAHAFKNNLAFLYRVHDKPELERLTYLQNVVKLLGIEVKLPQSPIPSEFSKAINVIKSSRFDDFMKMLFLRTMAKAEYSPKNIGHFGLASKCYTHFTSPIRRYPDLIVHRMLRVYFFQQNPSMSNHYSEILNDIASHTSQTEVRAVEVERKVADIKKAEFYEKFLGKSYEGTIVSVLPFGFFVEFPNKVGGLVHISTLDNPNFKITPDTFSISDGRKSFKIGDRLFVTIVGTQKDEGKINLVVSEYYEKWKNGSMTKK